MHALKPHENTLQPGGAVSKAPGKRKGPTPEDYIGKPWYRADWNRAAAEAELGKLPAGAFGLRPSSQTNAIAMSHSKGGGEVGHAIINIHHGEDNHWGYSIENRGV